MTGGYWRKSTRSSDQGGECVEVGQANAVLVRDTKNNRTGPVLRILPAAWTTFLQTLKA